jgi:hypothetical protein
MQFWVDTHQWHQIMGHEQSFRPKSAATTAAANNSSSSSSNNK